MPFFRNYIPTDIAVTDLQDLKSPIIVILTYCISFLTNSMNVGFLISSSYLESMESALAGKHRLFPPENPKMFAGGSEVGAPLPPKNLLIKFIVIFWGFSLEPAPPPKKVLISVSI